MQSNRLAGVVAAVPTPVTEAGEPCVKRFLRHGEWALANGCDGLNVLGTTGEANSLSPGQRMSLMTAAARDLDPQRLMVGTGAPDIETTVRLTRAACDEGFAAALVLPPFYYKAVSDDGLFLWFERVILATAAAPIPIYLYNFPQMTGIRISPALALRLARAHPDRVLGAKDSSGDLGYAAELAAIEGFDVFPSSETALARRRTDRFAGCISATVNVDPAAAAALWRDPGDEARLRQVAEMRAAVSSVPLIPAVKHMVGRIHDDPGFDRVLPPHVPLTAEEAAFLDRIPLPAGNLS